MSWDNEDRRKFVRAEFPCKLTISEAQDGPISTHTVNISAGGIRLIIKQRLAVCSIIDLHIHIPDKEPLICKGRVVWVFGRKGPFFKGHQLFDTGIEFYHIEEKDLNTINTLIASISSQKK